MSIPVLSNLDMSSNMLLDVTCEVLASDPGSVRNGRVFYNSTSGEFKVGQAGAWVSFLKATTRLDQLATPTAPVAMGSQKITGLADGTNANDAVTKQQLDALTLGLDVKQSVRVASVANVNISTPGATIDGTAMSGGNRVLLKDQTTSSENGIYIWNGAALAMTRATDADSGSDLTGGTFVFVEEGATNADKGFVATHNGTPVLGTDPITFTQFSASATITAGNGLSQTGSAFDVNVDGSSIEINADTLRVKALGITNAMLAGSIDLTTKVTGLLPIANGGTNANSAISARIQLGATGKYTALLGAGTTISVTHGLNTSTPLVTVLQESTKTEVMVEWCVHPTTPNDAVQIKFASAVAASAYRVIVVG